MVMNLFDAVLDTLSRRWKVPHKPRSKRAYRCECKQPVFFLNSRCLNCNASLGYEPVMGDLCALHPGTTAGTWRLVGHEVERDYRRCRNFDSAVGCNWLVAVDDSEELCLACRLNRTIPDLDDADSQRYWRETEAEKRRLVSQLLALELPVESQADNPETGLAFDLLRSPPDGPQVLTGHASGLITINIEEADNAKRERIRTDLHEPYRTLLGHFRHEIGHYYWDRLIRDTPWLEPFRALFGDERTDYAEAIKANYEKGPPADWSNRHISAYASAHPWEDWAETWAHYLHIVDSMDTAVAHGLDADDLEMAIVPFTRDELYDPDHPDAERALFLINSWVEMVTVLNEMARSLGQPDFYPFVMSKAVVKKLHFVNLAIRDAPKGSGVSTASPHAEKIVTD
jgi:hypothetical protein